MAAVVFTAVIGLVDIPMLHRTWRISKMDFYAAAIALGAVLLFGILQGMLTAAAAVPSLMLVARASQPHVAFLGRVPGTNSYSDLDRHPENEASDGVSRVPSRNRRCSTSTPIPYCTSSCTAFAAECAAELRAVVCDLSASPYIDLAGLADAAPAARRARLASTSRCASSARVARVRDLLRADGVGDKVGGLSRLRRWTNCSRSLDAPARARKPR